MPPRTRTKEAAKKRRHDEGGSSSGAARGESDLLVPGGRGLGHLSTMKLLRVEELQAKMVSGGYYFDYPLLDSYGCREGVERLTSQRYWEHLFCWRGDTYEPVIYEFMATLEMTEESHKYYISADQLGMYLGFYTQDDFYSEEYHNLPDDFDTDASMKEFWNRITGGTIGRFVGKKHNTGVIMSPILKAIKLLLGRRKNLHKIYRPIVTRLCEGLGLQRKLLRQKRKASMTPLGLEQLNRGYMRKVGDNSSDAEDEPQPPAPEVGEGQEVPQEYNMQYPEVHDWASMRARQIQLHTQSMDTFNRRMDDLDGAFARQEERANRQEEAIEQLRQWMENKFPPPSQGGDGLSTLLLSCSPQNIPPNNSKTRKMMNSWNVSSPPLSSLSSSPPPSPKGMSCSEMMVPKNTLEKGEPSRRNNDETSSDEEGWTYEEVLHRGLMLDVEDLFRFRHFKNKEIIAWKYAGAPLFDTLGIRREVERLTNQPFWREICGWRNNTYTPMVREFVATLEVDEEIQNHWEPCIKFKLFNKAYKVSADELGNLLGFYMLHDQTQEWYHNLLNDFENEHQPGLFWWCIAKPETTWSPSYVSSRYLRNPEVLVMWSIVAKSCMGRRTHNDNITKMLQRQHYEDSENIFVGPLVSRLCEALGHEDMLTRESVAARMVPMSREDYLHLNLVPYVPDCEEHEHPMCQCLLPQQTIVDERVALQTFIRQLYDEQEEERRGHEKIILDAFQEVGHRIKRLEEEVRRLQLTQKGEGPDNLRI
nr:uncharacterized protein LOC104900936 [Ipomoea batatas]